jgi:hypothetical protein
MIKETRSNMKRTILGGETDDEIDETTHAEEGNSENEGIGGCMWLFLAFVIGGIMIFLYLGAIICTGTVC